MQATRNATGDAVIVYDGECPVCSRYVTMVRLRDAIGTVRLVNARDADPLVDELKRTFDLNQGMVLKLGDRLYYGADCVNMLAMLSTPVGIFNRLNGAVFSSPAASKLLYPVLRAGRNLLLRLLGRSKISLAGQ